MPVQAVALSISPAVVVAFLGFAAVIITHIVMIARWTARLQTMAESHDSEIVGLRQAKHDHGQRIVVLETRVDAADHTLERLDRMVGGSAA